MADIKRYTFRFDGATEVHYLPRAPEIGERVTHGRELWFVADLSSDSVGELVICRRTNPARGDNDRAVEAHIAWR